MGDCVPGYVRLLPGCGLGSARGSPRGGRQSGERRLRLGYVEAVEERVAVVRSGSRERVVLGLNPNDLGFEVLDALLEPSHLGEEPRVGTADVTEKRLCHDGWSSTLSYRPMRCGS